MSVAKFKSQSFQNYLSLAQFVASSSTVASVVSVVCSPDGQYILFYLTP